MNVGNVDWCVALITPDATSNPHPQGLASILAYRDSLLSHLGSFYPQCILEELSHLIVTSSRGRVRWWRS